MSVYEDGKRSQKRSDYRKFRIRPLSGSNDLRPCGRLLDAPLLNHGLEELFLSTKGAGERKRTSKLYWFPGHP